MEPRIQYARTADGVSIAFAVSGAGPPLVSIPGPPDNHVGLEWQEPGRRASVEALSRYRTLIRFDGRGTGLSERRPGTYSLEERMLDLEAVVGRLGLTSFEVLSGDHGAHLAVAYAVAHPDHVRRMVLVSPLVSGRDFMPEDRRELMEQVIRRDYRTFTEMVGAMVFGWGHEEGPRYSAFFRECVTQEDAIAIYDAMARVDVSDLLPLLRCPVLVIETNRLNRLGRREGPARVFAAAIPDATYTVVEGGAVEGVSEAMLARIGSFVGEDWTGAASEVASTAGGPLGVILFTDIENHSALVQRLGDLAAREVLREYERLTRLAITSHGGTEVKAMGDGFMAWFPSASRALESAIALQRAFRRQSEQGEPLRVRVGLNAGEPVAEANDLFGTAVIVAARAAAGAAGGEIVATDVVRQLVAGRQFLFSDRGVAALKGFEDPVRTWLVSW